MRARKQLSLGVQTSTHSWYTNTSTRKLVLVEQVLILTKQLNSNNDFTDRHCFLMVIKTKTTKIRKYSIHESVLLKAIISIHRHAETNILTHTQTLVRQKKLTDRLM